MPKLMPKDLVAITTIVGILIYKVTGHNGGVDALLALVVGYYFAHRVDKTDKGI